MAKKSKNQDKPKKVNIYFDRLSIQMGFMNYEMCGFLMKMIVYYSMGEQDAVEKVKEDLKVQYPDSAPMVLMAFAENKVAIDEDLKAYAEVCEKRREAVAMREQYKRERMSSHDGNKEQMISNDNTRCQMISNTNTNTITNTKTSKDVVKEEKEESDNNLLSDVEKARNMVKELMGAEVWKESVCMKFSKKPEDIDLKIREFGVHVQTMDKVPADLSDAKRYFVFWMNSQEGEERKKAKVKKTQNSQDYTGGMTHEQHIEMLRKAEEAADLREEMFKKYAK